MKITLVTNAHISYNPRLLKEADALHGAGHDVRVVSITNLPDRVADDDKILASRGWRCTRLNFARKLPGGAFRWAISGIRMKLFTILARFTGLETLYEKSFCRYFTETYRELLANPADLYIAHNLQALPVAARAAAATGGLLGFDVEDYHIDEDSGQFSDSFQQRVKTVIMRRRIKMCVYVTATSEAMADILESELSIPRPTVLYNVFPLCYRAGVLPPDARRVNDSGGADNRIYTAYWFSHVVALDRGLQDFIKAMPLLDRRVDLHLRGGIHGDAREQLLTLAADNGVAERIHFLPPIHAEDLVCDAAQYDFGLALEQPVSKNRLITVTNKLFTYYLAGNAVVATATPGQREVMDKAEGAGFLYEPGDHRDLAAQINRIFSAGELSAMKCRSWEIGETIFNWDVEMPKFLSIIQGLEANVGNH